MIEQIRALVEQCLIWFRDGGERDLHSFLPDLLRDASDSLGKQRCGVAAARLLGAALRDHVLELHEKTQALGLGQDLIAEAALSAGVTYGAGGVSEEQQRVGIAIGAPFNQLQVVARGLSLLPQPLLAAAEENDASARARVASSASRFI